MAPRPKGYIDWFPRDEYTQAVLEAVRQILNEYRSYGPMTVRQIFYRLVGNYNYEKTELAYKRLCNLLVKARRAQLISFYDIRDSGTESAGGGGWDSKASFWSSVRYTANRYRLDQQRNQPYQIELWCEAAGMVPMLAGMLNEWSVPVYSTGGFSSLTVVKEVADRIASEDRPTIFLHVGDHDPSGESIFESMSEDIRCFIEADHGNEVYVEHTNDYEELFQPRRIAVTPAQIREYDLDSAPPKRSDSRSSTWVGSTTQAEALSPVQLEEIVQGAVLRYIDEEILDETREQEQLDKADIDQTLSGAGA